MKFSIITPTHRRSELLARAIDSVVSQDHDDWELIIVNDSPDDGGYASVMARYETEGRITYLINEKNEGVNFSRNRALAKATGGFVVFLDDDDYLAPDALGGLQELAATHPSERWFLTNRSMPEGKKFTRAPGSDTSYYYAWDYLITRRISGDATHCIEANLAKSARFATSIRQAEEWLFFFAIGRKARLFYHDTNTTYSDGYHNEGLNTQRPRGWSTWLKLVQEGLTNGLWPSPYFWLYLGLRAGKIVLSR